MPAGGNIINAESARNCHKRHEGGWLVDLANSAACTRHIRGRGGYACIGALEIQEVDAREIKAFELDDII